MSDSRLQGGRCSGAAKVQSEGSDIVVSVVIASFNCVDVIEGAIASVMDQEFPHKELIVVDGGSTDGTLDILRKYNDSIDFWVSEPDNGVYDALNKGIAFARGGWLYFLGTDDRFFSKKVLNQVFSRQVPEDMLYGNVLLKGTGVVGEDGEIYGGPFSKLKLCNKNICHQAIFYRKTLLERLGKYDMCYPLLADWVFNMKVFGTSGIKITYMDTLVAVYNAEGRSSLVRDTRFAKDKFVLIRRHLGWPLSFRLVIERKLYNAKLRVLSFLRIITRFDYNKDKP